MIDLDCFIEKLKVVNNNYPSFLAFDLESTILNIKRLYSDNIEGLKTDLLYYSVNKLYEKLKSNPQRT